MERQSYDVVVIGSGIGGISAAVLLAHAGYKTLVVEKLDQLGGKFSTREYEGFKLPTGALAIEVGGTLEAIFRNVGADFDVISVPLYYWIEGKYYEMPAKGRIKALLDILSKAEAERAKITGRIAKEIATEKILGALRQGRSEKQKTGMSFRDWLLQYTDNEKVLAVFQALIASKNSVNSWELPASEFFAFVARGGGRIGSYGFASRGNITLIESLAKKIRACDGEVWTGALAKQIVVANGEAKGVIVQKDEAEVEVGASVVISNAGPRKTVEMVGRENFNTAYLKEMNEKLTPAPIVAVFIASDRPLIEVPGIVIVAGLRRICFSASVTNLCPNLAPPGKHLLVTFAEPESCLKPMKVEEEIEANIQDLRNLIPEFDKYGKVLKAEAHDIYDEWPSSQSWTGRDLTQKTPIRNLYNVGGSVKPPGMVGLPACAESGRIVAGEVKKHFKTQRK